MSITIPTHKITDHAESGISIRRLTPDIVMPTDKLLHRDDYFAFCLLTKGEVSINVDFMEHTLLAGHIGCMLPGQVHQYATVCEPEGWMMFVDGIHLGEENLRVMQRFAPRSPSAADRRTQDTGTEPTVPDVAATHRESASQGFCPCHHRHLCRSDEPER